MPNTATALADNLLTYEQAAEYLSLTVSTVKQAVSAGRIPTVKLPKNARKYVTREALDAYRERRYRYPAATAAPAQAPAQSTGAPTPEELAAIKARASAAGAPLLEGWREASKGLTTIGIAALLGVRDPEALAGLGALLDPKRIAG